MIIIDATDKIAGRIGTFAAKKALMGEQVRIINSERAVITGKKSQVFDEFLRKRQRGTPKGPHYPKRPDRILRRIIRGMVPFKKSRGKDAYRRIHCYVGVPQEFENKKTADIKGSDISKLQRRRYVYLETISKRLGAKFE